MEQSQVKFSHCWMHTPMLAHESSWQVVLGPGKKAGKGRGRERYHRRKQKKKRKERMKAVKHVTSTTRRQHAEKIHRGRRGAKQWHHRKQTLTGRS